MFGSMRASADGLHRRSLSKALILGALAAGLVVLTGCGGGGGGGGSNPGNVADPQDIFVVDQGNSRISRFSNMSGLNRVNYGTVGTGTGQFTTPTSIAVDSTGKIYVADTGNNRVVAMDDFSGTNFTGLGAAGGANFGTIGSIAVDAFDRILIADTTNNRIVRVSNIAGGSPVVLDTTTLGVTAPQFITFDNAGGIIFTSAATGVVHRVSLITGFNHTSFNTGLASIGGIAVDATNHIYVSDTAGNRIIRYDDMTGANPVTLGGPAAGSGVNQFSGPTALSIDSAGRLVISDTGNNRIVRITSITGSGWTTYGTVGIGLGNFQGPAGVTLH